MKPNPPSSRAFSLVEVTLALGIAAFALVAILGLVPIGLNSNQSSVQQTAATSLAVAIIADLRQVPSTNAFAANASLSKASPRYGVDVTSATAKTFFLDEAGGLQPSAGTARYKATITLTQPAAGAKSAIYGSLLIGWPAAALNPLGAVTVFVALDRN